MPKYVLTGADGKLGRVAADFALELARPGDELVFTTQRGGGAPVPEAVRAAWAARGATVVPLSYDDSPETQAAVFAGAAAVAFGTPWGATPAQRRALGANVVAACVATGSKPRLVYASLVGAGKRRQIEVVEAGAEEEEDMEQPGLVRDHAAVERAVARSGLPYAVHRDFLFADAVAEAFAPAWRASGDAWLDNGRHVRGAFVSRADCGRVHAALLLGRPHDDDDEEGAGGESRAYDVTGPELVTAGQMMDWVCGQTGYQCEMVAVSDDELRRWWAARGLPADTAAAMLLLQKDEDEDDEKKKAAAAAAAAAAAGDKDVLPPMPLGLDDLVACGRLVARGAMQEITDTVERLTGRAPRCFRQTLVHYKAGFPQADDTSDCDHVGASREEER